MVEGSFSLSSLHLPTWGSQGSRAGAWVMTGIPSALCTAFSSKPVSQPRTAQPQSSQPPPASSVKKASTDLLADIGGDPFAAPQVAPAFAAFPAFGGKWDLGRELLSPSDTEFHLAPALHRSEHDGDSEESQPGGCGSDEYSQDYGREFDQKHDSGGLLALLFR